jgi:hypothetical protein
MTMTETTRYFAAGWDFDEERARLRLIEELYDPATTRRLSSLGLTSGWRCLPEGTSPALDTAAGLYRGDLVTGLGATAPPFEDWLMGERTPRRQLQTVREVTITESLVTMIERSG